MFWVGLENFWFLWEAYIFFLLLLDFTWYKVVVQIRPVSYGALYESGVNIVRKMFLGLIFSVMWSEPDAWV